MKYLDVNLNKLKATDVKLIVGSFQAGKVVAMPTDTIYGLSCLASDTKAVRRIYDIKKRSLDRPVLVLVDSVNMLKKYAHLSKKQEEILKKIWSDQAQPTTVILKSRSKLTPESEGPKGSLALRLPKSDFLIKILRGVKEPLVSTSLNISGQKNISDVKNINNYFSKKSMQPDLVIDAGENKNNKSSRVLDLRTGEIKIIRK